MSDLINQFAKQPIWFKLLLVAIIIAGIGFYEFQMVVVPHQQDMRELRAKVGEATQKLVENEAIAANLPRFQEEVNILNEQLKQAVALLPNQPDIHSILRQLHITAKKTNVDLTYFKPGGTQGRGFYDEISMDLKIDGTYHEIATFLDQVGKQSRIINVSNIAFSNIRSGTVDLPVHVDCLATTFMFRGGQ